MTRKQHPSAYTVTADDLAQVVQEHAIEWEATAYFVLTLGRPNAPEPYFEVTIRDGIFAPGGAELGRLRFPLGRRGVDGWPANMMHGLMAAYEDLKSNPWKWPAGKRARVAADDA